MRNILATSLGRWPQRWHWAGAALALLLIAAAAWGAWATCKLRALERREVVTVELGRLMGDFVEAEAHSGRPAEATRARVEAYLHAVDASVARLGRDGRTVLVAEAVVAGNVPDMTGTVRIDVARRMGAQVRDPR